jgi:hypothetical protein
MGASARTLSKLTATGFVCLLLGCCPTAPRGWIGGDFKQVESKPPFTAPPNTQTIWPLPLDIAKRQKGAVFVTRVFPNTPLALAGIRGGDVILAVNGRKINYLASFRKTVEAAQSGETLRLTVYREAAITDFQVAVGQEVYSPTETRSACIGLFFDPEVDLWPDSDFDILGWLGYQQWDNHTDLASPECIYANQVSPEKASGPGCGWAIYLGPVRFLCQRKVIEQRVATGETSTHP